MLAIMMAGQQQQSPTFRSANTMIPYQKRPRPNSISIFIPPGQPLTPEMSYNRQLSPGAKRIINQGRTSDNLTDPYRYERHNSYTSPRTSTSSTANTNTTTSGVIPISTQTFVNYPPPPGTNTTRPEPRHDAYSGRPIDSYTGRPRRSSLVDPLRGTNSTTTNLPSRSRPNVIQADGGRPSSPLKGSARDKDYYVTPASSKESRKVEHKKLYSVDGGTASLVADVDTPVVAERHHRRRESDGGERVGYRGLASDRDRDRGRRGYHPNGESRIKEKTVEDEGAYSYTDAAGMFRDTEPRWREREARPRRGSVDRGGASRERPISMLDPSMDPRRSNKDIGPPPSTRGFARLNEGIGRAASLRDRSRDVPQSPSRVRVPQSPNRARAPTSPTRGRYGDSRDPYYVAPRTTSEDRRNTYQQDRPIHDGYEYEERREPRHHQRRNSVTKHDQSVERRGFGIRADSQDRYGRGSDESFERQKYRDSAYEPHRRDTAPEINYHEEQRLEQEKQDRMRSAQQYRGEDRDRYVERDSTRRRDDDRSYNRDRDHDRERERRDRDREYDLDRERERERERMMQPPPDHERHHIRRESNVDYNAKESNSRAPQSEAPSQSGFSTAAAGGLAGAGAAYAIGKAVNNRNDDRERERDRDLDRRPERPREHDRDRLSPRPAERPYETHSDEGVRYSQERERDRQPTQEKDRGLGFAFEGAPEPPRSAPPNREPATSRERVDERQHEDKAPPQAPHQPIMDPDEDYRRRMEQVQRELGQAPAHNSDSDPDRERRRREREQRQRDRCPNGESSVPAGASTSFDSTASSRMPGAYDDDSNAGAYSTASSRPGLHRKPSILDAPMNDEPVQILDNSMSNSRENRVRIVDPPTEEEEKKPKGILKKPTTKFPDHSGGMREGVAPLKDASKSGIPPGARWTKIDRRLVNPQALTEAQERFEERMDCVIVLRVLTKEDIQKLADRTKAIRDERYEEERSERHAHHRRNRDRKDRDEYLDEDSEDEFKPRQPKMLEGGGAGVSTVTGVSAGESADFVRDRERDRDRDRGARDGRDREYSMSGGLGRRGEEGY